jgi:GvpD gas vesicle protein
MARQARAEPDANGWTALDDPDGSYSTGISDFDRLLGGGYRRGSLALFSVDESVDTADLGRILDPTFLNFLHHSRGIIAVLPARESPAGFRERVTRYTTRRRFDSRVRVVDYVGEAEPAPYVVPLVGVNDRRKAPEMMRRMAAAEKAAQGIRQKSFLELNAFEVMETVAGAETAARMFLFGIKRARAVSNLVIGILRPGLRTADAVRAMADVEFALRRDEVGLTLRGVRPKFPAHVVTADPVRGAPFVRFVPGPGAPG